VIPVKGETFYFTPEFPKSPHLENAVRVQVQSVSRDSEGVAIGVKFDPSQPMAVRESVAHMIFGDSASWEAIRAMRNKKMGLFRGMGYVFYLSYNGIIATLRALAAEPARLARQKARERTEVIVEADTNQAHMLAFGEAFDPEPSTRPISMLQAAIAQTATEREQAGQAQAARLREQQGDLA